MTATNSSPEGEITQPTKRFGWGVWSTGNIAGQFAADLDHVAGATKAAVCSRDLARAQAFADRLGFAAAHDDADAFVNDPSVDLIYIASPHTAHIEQALAAIGVGKPVLIEKPIAMTAAEARRIGEAARAAGVFAMEALWARFLPGMAHAKAMIAEGRLGTIERAEVSLIFHRAFDPVDRLFDPALGGGASRDLAVYPISIATHLLGLPALEEAAWQPAPNGVDLSAQFRLRCGEVPVTAEIGFVGSADDVGENTFIVQGDRATMRIDAPFIAAPSITLWAGPKAATPKRKGLFDKVSRRLPLDGRRSIAFDRQSKGLCFQAQAVQAAVSAGLLEEPRMPIEESAHVLSVIEEILDRPASERPFG